MRVSEIFLSIQGETTAVGLPCVFVRLTGCPLRCSWCDTKHAHSGGMLMTERAIMDKVLGYGVNLVCVTGGEPLAQSGTGALLWRLRNAGKTVMLETSGALDISTVQPFGIVIMDIKCPGSGMGDRMYWDNMDHLRNTDQVKFVLADRADYDHATTVIKQRRLLSIAGEVLLSPVHGQLDPAELAGWMIADRSESRLQVPLHKTIWPNRTQGV